MPAVREQRAVFAQAAWMLSALILLSVIGRLSLELYFVLSLVGLLVVSGSTASASLRLRPKERLRLIAVVGLLVFGYIVGSRLAAKLPFHILF